MATITLKSGTLYSGPGMDYVVATTGVNGRSAELLWREGNYYYVRPNNMNVQGYISASDVTMPIGTKYDIFSPVVNNSAKRYVIWLRSPSWARKRPTEIQLLRKAVKLFTFLVRRTVVWGLSNIAA